MKRPARVIPGGPFVLLGTDGWLNQRVGCYPCKSSSISSSLAGIP